jgi:hypothetical protein
MGTGAAIVVGIVVVFNSAMAIGGLGLFAYALWCAATGSTPRNGRFWGGATTVPPRRFALAFGSMGLCVFLVTASAAAMVFVHIAAGIGLVLFGIPGIVASIQAMSITCRPATHGQRSPTAT